MLGKPTTGLDKEPVHDPKKSKGGIKMQKLNKKTSKKTPQQAITLVLHEKMKSIANLQKVKVGTADIEEIIIVLPEKAKELYPRLRTGIIVSAKSVTAD